MIYLVDDDKSVRRAFEMFLKSAGLGFQSFESADKFLTEYTPVKQDILVLDLNLPGMSGYELLKKFKQGGIHIPVIVVTAFDEPQSRKYCREYGVKAYMRKPVDGEALIDMIKYYQN
jgi:FixJ family two-component response regulator